MIVLAIDTCDSRGSVALLRDDVVLGLEAHESVEDYSVWLLPAVARVLREAGLAMVDVDGYAVAAGPGSFTGVRVALTTAKAWAEVYQRPVVAVSRLEAVALQARVGTEYVAAAINARRGQVFGAIYRSDGSVLVRIGEEMVIAAGQFLTTAAELAHGERIAWASTDPDCLLSEEGWPACEKRNGCLEPVSGVLAVAVARIGVREHQAGRFTDALGLDANYVQRCDAEIFLKGGSAHGR